MLKALQRERKTEGMFSSSKASGLISTLCQKRKRRMMREKRDRGGGGSDGNCFRQRQWGAIRVIKLISRANKGRDRGMERRRRRTEG